MSHEGEEELEPVVTSTTTSSNGLYYQDTYYELIEPFYDGNNSSRERDYDESKSSGILMKEEDKDGIVHINNISSTLSTSSPSSKSKNELVVCIHGIGSYSGHFNYLIPILKHSGYRILIYDLIGRGNSKLPTKLHRDDGSSIFDGPGHVQQLRELIIFLNFHQQEKYHIIAHSMGGAIATLYTIQYSNEINSLILLSPAGLMDLGIVKLIRRCQCLHNFIKRILQNNQEKAWIDDFQYPTNPIPLESINLLRQITLSNQHHFNSFWSSLLSFPLYDLDNEIHQLAKQHQISISILWGNNDRGVPINPSLRRWKNIFRTENHPLVQYKVYENSAHGFFIEFHDVVNQDIVQFLHNTRREK